MAADFTDIRIVGLDEEHTTRADPTLPLYDVHFLFSAPPPVGWARFAHRSIGRKGIAGRQGWPRSQYFVVRCAIDEIPRVLAALGPVLGATNRAYQEWATSQEAVRVEAEAFDVCERQKLRELKARLRFD
jgi:hypothetical protein